jgi:hypothetical protein
MEIPQQIGCFISVIMGRGSGGGWTMRMKRALAGSGADAGSASRHRSQPCTTGRYRTSTLRDDFDGVIARAAEDGAIPRAAEDGVIPRAAGSLHT